MFGCRVLVTGPGLQAGVYALTGCKAAAGESSLQPALIYKNSMNDLVKLYGLPYCDGTKAAMEWLEKKGIAPALHNYKTDGISRDKLTGWCRVLGWEKILNKRSTTWRGLDAAGQNAVTDLDSAVEAMMKNTSLIKRPVIEYGKNLLVGFDEKKLSDIFK